MTFSHPLFFRWCKPDVPVSHVSVFSALKVDGAGSFFVAVKRAAGDAGNFLIVNYGFSILHDCDLASYERDIETLPLARLARHFRRGSNETVYPTGVMTCGLLN